MTVKDLYPFMPREFGDSNAIPAFALSVFNDVQWDVTLTVHIPEKPKIKRHASLGLLYGLAIMTLDRQGVIERMVDQLLERGPINEVDASNRIAALLAEDANELPV